MPSPSTVLSIISLLLKLFTAYIIYFLIKILYRLTLHPLARFPGPKKAAISRLYAISYDLPQKTSYIKEFVPWHDKYNSPIIRIEPNHLHIRDIDAYNEIYKVGTKLHKDPAIYNFPATEGSLFNELDPKAGVVHRSVYNAYFSKSSVENSEAIVHEHVAKFLAKLDEAAKSGKCVDLTLGFRCLMADTLTHFTMGTRFGALDAPDFQDKTIASLQRMSDEGGATMSWYASNFFAWVFRGFMKLPRDKMPIEPLRHTLQILENSRSRITELSQLPKEKQPQTAFQTALDPTPKKGRTPSISTNDLAADGLMFFFAGVDTTSNALTFATYHLSRNPTILSTLLTELDTAIPNLSTLTPTSTFPTLWPTLEKLPHLRSIIKESLRLSHGVPGKIPRLVPATGMTLCNQFIPGGTAISSCAYSYFMNPTYFVSPETFKPSRWLQDDARNWADNNGVDPDKYFIPFSRGSRSCLGMYLATAQLYVTVAYLLRSFEVVLDEGMGEGDMEWSDAFIIATFGRLKVRVRRRGVKGNSADSVD